MTVLIVEDEVIQTLLLNKIIQQLGFKVIGKATSGEQAIQEALKNSPDIITMDIKLEGEMDGIRAVEEIHKHNEIPVIYITGNSDKYNYERAKKTNFADFLSKPISFNILASSLSQIIGNMQIKSESGS